MRVRVEYFDHGSSPSGADSEHVSSDGAPDQAALTFPSASRSTSPSESPFVAGEAGVVWVERSGLVETDTRVRISPNSLHALRGLGVTERLNALGPAIGPIGSGRDALLGPEIVERALRIFYEADRATYGVRHDLLVRAAEPPEAIEYRIVIDNREYQKTLSKLQFMTSTAARYGLGVRLRV